MADAGGTGEHDLAVIGGGLVGASVAWGLARLGQRVVVLDEGDVAFRASRGNFALVWVQSKGMGMPEYAAWTRRSSDAWAGLAASLRDETGVDVAFDRPGGFTLALSETELETRVAQLTRLHNQPDMVRFDFEVMDRARVAAVLPHVGPDVVGATYCPLDGHVNALRLFRALHVGMQRLGARYLPNRPVERIDPKPGGGFAIRTPAGTVEAAKVVLAAGLGNATLGPMVGLTVPVRPQRGQVLVTERTAPFLRHPVVTVRQTDEGGVMLGDSQEEAGFDPTVDTRVLSVVAERAIRMFPLIGRLNVVRSWAALRVMTRDGFPIYEQSAACPGAFVVTCHSGVTLAANHALVLPRHIVDGHLPGDVFGVFGAGRFDVPAAA